MSADNGIYIGIFGNDNNEFRVIHAQAIDNVFWPDGENAEYIVDYFQDATCFPTIEEAELEANKMADEIYSDDFCPILEYGISYLRFTKKFSDYIPQAVMKLEN
jgi:uncharacterized protein with ParB-like and HNH nuclease domain